MLLAFDTSSRFGYVALLHENRAVEMNLCAGWQHGRLLISAAQELFAKEQIAPSAISAVVCGVGPGSYTGTRIGVAAAKTLAWGLQKKMIAVSSLAALALIAAQKIAAGEKPSSPQSLLKPAISSAVVESPVHEIIRHFTNAPVRIIVLQPARVDEFYVGVYKISDSATNKFPRALVADSAKNPQATADLITDDCVVIGEGWEKYPAVFEPLIARQIVFYRYEGCRSIAKAGAQIAAQGGGETVEPLTFAPLYLRRDESPCRFEIPQ